VSFRGVTCSLVAHAVIASQSMWPMVNDGGNTISDILVELIRDACRYPTRQEDMAVIY
jgi:hypothetical protein